MEKIESDQIRSATAVVSGNFHKMGLNHSARQCMLNTYQMGN